MTLHTAAALRSPAFQLPVKYGCKSTCSTQWCNCVKANVKCTQYCHSGHLDCSNLPATIAEQTKVPIVLQTNPATFKRKQGDLTPAKLTKKLLINQDKPPPHMHGLKPTSTTSLPTQAQSAKMLAEYPNTAGVVAQLSFICLCLPELEKDLNKSNFIGQAVTSKSQDGSSAKNDKSEKERRNSNGNNNEESSDEVRSDIENEVKDIEDSDNDGGGK